MAFDKVLAPLLRVPLLAGLKPLQITEIARQAERIKFRSGDTITKAGTLGDGAYLIVSGDAERRPEPESHDLPEPVEPGSLVGELAMLVEHVYGATVAACGRVHCIKLTRAALHDQMQADPELARHFAHVIGGRLREVAAELRRIDEELSGRTAPAPDAPNADGADTPPALPVATGTDG